MQHDWSDEIFAVLKQFQVGIVSYVPDAGHAKLISAAITDPSIHAVSLTTEEEGVALSAGAWLGGMRSVLLMQSSGVGNCVNMLSLVRTCRFPFLTIVTMRGEWAEFNPWQVPMANATEEALRMMDIRVLRAHQQEEVGDVVSAGASLAYSAGVPSAVLISQRVIGAKDWRK